MTAISVHAMDLLLDLPHNIADAVVFEPEADRAPGMPLLGFIIAIVLSVPLWALIGFTTWTLLS
jgi:hypothetical protein